MQDSKLKYHYFITLGAALLFIPFLGKVHLFDWDEINFAECAREMLVSGDYGRVQLNFQPFWEKPPLFIWMQALCMKLFGVNEFAARLPDALCGIVTLNLIFGVGYKINGPRFAWLWVLAYAGSFLPFLYFKSGIIDPWFNLFIFLSIYQALQWLNDNVEGKANRHAAYAGVFAGLAVLTKGPVALLIIGLSMAAAWLWLKLKLFGNLKNLFLFIGATLVTGLSWFLYEILTGHFDIVKEFIDYQVRLFSTEDSDHGGFLLYHFVVLLVGCFPASLFFIQAHRRSDQDTPYQAYTKKWMICLFWVVLILFTIVKTKIVHYSSMCYFPLSYLAAYTLHNILYRGKKWNGTFLYIGLLITVVAGVAFTLIPFAEKFKADIISSGIIKDDFAMASLSTTVDWGGYEFLTGLFFLIGSVLYLIKMFRRPSVNAAYGLFSTSLISAWLLIVTVTPKIEQYSQGPAIEFYKNLQGKDCYVETIGFKSYAYMFYTNRQPSHNSPAMLAFINRQHEEAFKKGHAASFSFNLMSLTWMMEEKIDKPAYFVIKITQVDETLKAHPSYKEIYRKGGFAFLKREPENQ